MHFMISSVVVNMYIRFHKRASNYVLFKIQLKPIYACATVVTCPYLTFQSDGAKTFHPLFKAGVVTDNASSRSLTIRQRFAR